mmetsp:Transcript_38717/g.95728  ORF Transcript_38717/g.95728 Transcript_38717/m.95728 type:complete len:106 (+) Transcript_38717:379-696(+)
MTTLSLAASVGCVDVLEELVDNRQCVLTAWACRAAATKGQLGALTWLRSRNCPWDFSTCNAAAYGGHLEVLRYAHEHGCPSPTGILAQDLAREVAKYLRAAGVAA